MTDCVSDECDLDGKKYLAVEYLPGQFAQRASSAVACVRLIEPTTEVRIKSSKLLIFDSAITDIAGNANPKLVLFDLAVRMCIYLKA